MESPLEEMRATWSTSRNEETETDGCELSSGDSDSAQGQATGSTSRNEDSETDGGELSSGHLESEQGQFHGEESFRESFTEAPGVHPATEEKETERDGSVDLQEEQMSPEAPAAEQSEPSSFTDDALDESMYIGPEAVESEEQAAGDTTGTTDEYVQKSFTSEKEIERDGSASVQDEQMSPKAPADEESGPSSSRVAALDESIDIGLEVIESDEQVPDNITATTDEYVKKSFTCDSNVEGEDEQLREYWTRALQTSTSTGEIVEEIVKVLKHHQNTHDLLCPVCGSCVTRRVILRKRKRSSLISVDRWYRDSVEEEAEVPDQGYPLEITETGDTQEYQTLQDTEAFGCLKCFSLFFRKGRQLLNQFQEDVGRDAFNCLPFFFPPYPWGMTQTKARSPGLPEEETSLPAWPDRKGSGVLDMQKSLTADVEPDFKCGLGTTLLPDYPWGMMPPSLSKGAVYQSSNQTETGTEVVVTGAVSQDVEQVQEDVPQAELSQEISQPLTEERTCTSGLAPALLPAYPWGFCTKAEEGVISSSSEPEAITKTVLSGALSQGAEQIQGTEIVDSGALSHDGQHVQDDATQDMPRSKVSDGKLSEEIHCTCGLAPALFPAYPWGSAPKIEEVVHQSPELEAGPEGVDASAVQVEDTIMQGVSQTEVSEETSQNWTEDRHCICGLVPSLLPDYPWGSFPKVEGTYSNQTEGAVTRMEPGMEVVEEKEKKPEDDDGLSCELISSVLPAYPWGVRTQSEEVLEEVPVLENKSRLRHEENKISQNYTHGYYGLEGVASAVLPPYPWGICSVKQTEHEENGGAWHPSFQGSRKNNQSKKPPASLQMLKDKAEDVDCTCGLGPTIIPKYPWGQNLLADDKQVKNYTKQVTKIEAHITSKTNVFTKTTSKKGYTGGSPPEDMKSMVPQQTSQTIESVKLDQTVTVLNVSIEVDETLEIKTGPKTPLASSPSTGFALLDLADQSLPEKVRLETRPSTGYTYLEEFYAEAESKGKGTAKIQEHEAMLQTIQTNLSKTPSFFTKPSSSHAHVQDSDAAEKSPLQTTPEIEPKPQKNDPFSASAPTSYGRVEDVAAEISEIEEEESQPETGPQSKLQTIPEATFYKHEKSRPQSHPIGLQFTSFQWSVGNPDAGDLTTPLLKESMEPEAKTFIPVLKPSSGGVDEGLSVPKVSVPSDEEGIAAPLLSAAPGRQSVAEAVIDVPPSDPAGVEVRTVAETAPALLGKKTKEADGWDILKSIVYGGLDISIASLGVTSSAAGGNAITRTVVYMGLATLFSGLIGFYHSVLNLYHHHKDHYTDVVGLTLLLHGTIALISYFIFGVLSPLIYALSYRETDDRDDKFILCCGVTVVTVTLLSLGKAKVSKKRYFRTVFSYLSGGVLAAVVGYLTGEHVAELLERWGI